MVLDYPKPYKERDIILITFKRVILCHHISTEAEIESDSMNMTAAPVQKKARELIDTMVTDLSL